MAEELIILERVFEGALNYLSPYFQVGNKRNPEKPSIAIAPILQKEVYAKINLSRDKKILTFDLDKFRKNTKKELMQVPRTLDLILGEEAGHLLHYSFQPQLYNRFMPENARGLQYASELIAHYSGLVYCNREGKKFGRGIEGDKITETAYRIADYLFEKFGDEKLKDLATTKSLFEVGLQLRLLPK